MRRIDRAVTATEEILKIIARCDVVRLGLSDGDYPYIVPLNFGFEMQNDELLLYVHGAKVGRKAELMARNGVCSFEMDCGHKLVPLPDKEGVTMYYGCVMGKATITLLEGEEKRHGIRVLMEREDATRDYPYTDSMVDRILMAKLTVTELSCKQNPRH